MEQIGKLMLLSGLTLSVLGALVWLLGRTPWLKLGRLPGDVAIERSGFSMFIPITTMLLISAVLSFLLWLLQRGQR